MDILFLSKATVKIKTKNATYLAINNFEDPSTSWKIATDGVLFFDKSNLNDPKNNFENSPPVIAGPGEYEIKGIKISGFQRGEKTFYSGKFDGINVLFGVTSALLTLKEALQDCQLLVLYADALIDQKIVSLLSASNIILYGPFGKEVSALIKTDFQTANKFSFTKDKLGEDLQVMLLG